MSSTPDKFDYAILGGGAAGLSLALALRRSPLRDRSILVVEKDAKDSNDRTWCFWTDAASPYDGILRRTWPRLAFESPTVSRRWELAPFRYAMLRGLDFYRHAQQELANCSVTFLRGAGEVQDGSEGVTVCAGDAAYHASWAFDSRVRREDIAPGAPHNLLFQHFLGWEIETDAPVFDPQTVTMFDLRTLQQDGITFFYTLPFSETRALVEYTLFSPRVLPLEAYEQSLRGYFQERLGLNSWRVLETERGVIPMTDQPFPRRIGRRVLAIGTRGGRVKPSTGYAFARIQRDSQAIVDSLLRKGHPFSIPPDPLRFRMQDSILLEILAREPQLGEPIFSSIFKKNPVQRVLRFLDNRSNPLEDLAVMASHEPGPFLRAIGRRYFRIGLHGG